LRDTQPSLSGWWHLEPISLAHEYFDIFTTLDHLCDRITTARPGVQLKIGFHNLYVHAIGCAARRCCHDASCQQ
jgi:hypothetical protein